MKCSYCEKEVTKLISEPELLDKPMCRECFDSVTG